MLKLANVKQLSDIQTTEIVDIPHYIELLLNSAYSESAFVVFIFSVAPRNSFDGYAIMKGAVQNKGRFSEGRSTLSCGVEVVRRATVAFNEVSYIRDDLGLHGRPITTANSGSVLGLVAARALCRLIDRRAYRDDPFHYRDTRLTRRVQSSEQHTVSATIIPPSQETALLQMDYAAYREWFAANGHTQSVPSLVSLKFI